MKLNDIRVPRGARRKKKRVGRGAGSGHGKTSTRGHKGLKARTGAGGKLRHGFEGGQMPLIRSIPKRGFNSKFRVEGQIVSIESLNKFDKDTRVDLAALKKAGLTKSVKKPVKILGDGELKKSLTVAVHAFSKSAKEKIEKSGGKVEVIK